MTWAAIWDAFTAVGTVAMAVTTGLVIRQSKQQHRDTFRPICVLIPDHGLDQFARCDIVQCQEDSAKPNKFYLAKCGIRNIGGGPAVHLRLIVNFLQYPGIEFPSELPPLGAKQRDESPLKIPVILRDQFNRMDYEVAPDGVWELWLVYEDVFGRVFHTRHTKNPQQPWTSFGKGDKIRHD